MHLTSSFRGAALGWRDARTQARGCNYGNLTSVAPLSVITPPMAPSRDDRRFAFLIAGGTEARLFFTSLLPAIVSQPVVLPLFENEALTKYVKECGGRLVDVEAGFRGIDRTYAIHAALARARQ